ncbi:MAG: PTS transporter subunit EIIC, partial [Steroidobacteraceae bacterium]|nr:PTS transporter subunit EIIC [Steroidobacteraceae bacterium]
FFAGDPSAGAFMSGFFPVMMFGLPAACLAMYRAALPARRKAVGGLLLSMALTSFLTGVTEPIEFAFMFLAPVLYAVHAVLTGTAMVLMHVLDVHLGFGFSAGLFDYVLNYKLATKPLLLLPIGAAYFAIYFVVFRWAILRFNLSTPGREPEDASAPETDAGDLDPSGTIHAGASWARALGGANNLQSIDACTTRLRLTVADNAAVDERALRRLGARGFVRPSAGTLQVVVGPIADQLAGDIRAAIRAGDAGVDAEVDSGLAARLAGILGGRANVVDVEAWSTRLVINVRDPVAIDVGALESAARGAVRIGSTTWHVIVGPLAAQTAAALRAL